MFECGMEGQSKIEVVVISKFGHRSDTSSDILHPSFTTHKLSIISCHEINSTTNIGVPNFFQIKGPLGQSIGALYLFLNKPSFSPSRRTRQPLGGDRDRSHSDFRDISQAEKGNLHGRCWYSALFGAGYGVCR